MASRRSRLHVLIAVALAATVAVLSTACAVTRTADPSSTAARQAVLIPADYQPPSDHVDSTGAFLPANGKPTLVFVDAIW